MADSAYTKKAPCVGFFTPFDPTTCEPLTVTHVFKLAGDTPIETAPEYADDQDWTERATDQSQCGPPLVKRGQLTRSELTLSRCLSSPEFTALLLGSNGRALSDGTDTTGYVESIETSLSICSQAPLPSGLLGVVSPIGKCGSSGYCATGAGNCVVEVWPFVTEPRLTARNVAAVSDPWSASFWAYGLPADIAANIPANIQALFPGGLVADDFHAENQIDCALVPPVSCTSMLTADLFVP